MNYLVVVAHPDDEVLGAGATIHKLVKDGNDVAVVVMCSEVDARFNKSSSLFKEQQKVLENLGVQKLYCAKFPNIKMNNVPHLELVQFIEKCIMDFKAESIITHHPSDPNIDHYETSRAVMAACRLFQRQESITRLKEVLYMEVLSSTEWSIDCSSNRFTPNYFVEIGKDGVDNKIKMLSVYKGVIKEYPHPRSVKSIDSLAAYRGAQSGCNYAEAFECVFRTY